MNRTREKLQNANKWCHIYTDIDGVTNIHNTETNETYRIIPETSALGVQIERHKDGELKARNTISFDEFRILSDLAGSNHLLEKLAYKGGEVTEDFNTNKMTREEKLETIVQLFAKTMFYGDWGWETPNERVIEMLMKEVGYYPFKDEDEMIYKTLVSDDLYKKAIKEIPTRRAKGGNEWWKGNGTVTVRNDDLVPYNTICGCNPANGGSGMCGCTMANQMVRKGGTTITTTSTNSGLVSLDEHNSNAWSTQVNMNMYSSEPKRNGIACPKCGNELMDSNPMATLTSHPAQKDVHCSKCEYKGYRII
jgi:hypothetical protein